MINVVDKMGDTVPTLYHSSDSDDFTVASRVLSMKTGQTSDITESLVIENPMLAQKSLKEFDHVKWSFHSRPSLDYMWKEAEAFREARGTYPHHTIIDIMMNIDFPGVEEQNYWALMPELNDMAREQQTAVTVVHHTSEAAKAGSPPPRAAIMGKANQLPVLILTLWGDGEAGNLQVAVVKNRFGPQDAMAKKYFNLKAEPGMCRINEYDFQAEPPIKFDQGPWMEDDD